MMDWDAIFASRDKNIDPMDSFGAGVALGAATSVVLGAIAYMGWRHTSTPGNTRWRHVGTLQDIVFYPLKSGAGIPLDEAICDVHGLQAMGLNHYRMQDRCFAAFDSETRAIVTNREYPKLVLVKWNESGENYVTFEAPGEIPITVSKPSCLKENRRLCSLWNGDSAYVMDFGDAASRWISRFLVVRETKRNIHLGYFCPKFCQGRNFGTSLKNLQATFPNVTKRDFGIYCDFAPYTLLAESSVKTVNANLTSGVSAAWFRPTFIVSGPREFEEDSWNYIKIGEAIFQNIMPCHRDLSCCVNPATGTRSEDGEPFKSLYKCQRLRGGANRRRGLVTLGVGLGLRETGRVRVGDGVFTSEVFHSDK